MPITPLFDQVGPHARSVEDLQLFDAVMSGREPAQRSMSLQGLRLGVPRGYYYGGLADHVARIMANVLERLTDAGVVLVEADVPDLEELIELTTAPAQILDVVPRFNDYLETYEAELAFSDVLAEASDDIRHVFAEYVLPGGKHSLPQDAFEAARDTYLPALRRTMQTYFRDNDVIAMIFPATMRAAPRIGQDVTVDIDGTPVPLDVALARNISPGSTSGIPGLVLPAGLSPTGLPVSIELDGPQGSDQTLLALGQAVEGVLGRLAPPRISA
jgi:mandelamide amidase